MLLDYLYELIPETVFADFPELLVLALIVLMVVFLSFVRYILASLLRVIGG